VNPQYGTSMRVEHWTNAIEQARAVAVSIVDGPRPYGHVPYVWSKQYGHMIQVVGRFIGQDRVVVRPTTGVGGLTAWYGSRDAVEGVVTVDRPRVMSRARRVLAGRGDPGALIDLIEQGSPLEQRAKAG
jgi:hypothetical protein